MLLGRGHGVRATNLFLTLSRHPLLFFPWLLYASRLIPYGRLDRRDVELVILRVAWLTRCHYEWNQHVVIARQAGLSDAEILAVTEGQRGASEARIEMLFRACDEVISEGMLSAATHQALIPWFDEKSRIELLFLIGQYQMLAGVIHGLGVQLESDTDIAVG
jgi:AhpD family alkylhydroperoxidase